MDYETVLNEVESWPVDDRIRLVQDVWGRLVDEAYEPELSDEQKAEIDRRIEELDRNPERGIPWEDVKAQALAWLKK